MGQTVEKSEGGATTVSQSVKPFTNFFLILGAVASLAIIPSATGAPPFFNIFYPNEETAIQPGSVISGYPIPPAYTLTRYDEDYSYLANPANRTDPLDVIKYLPLFNWGPSYFLTLGGDIREQYEFIQNDNFGLGSVNNHGYWLQRLMPYCDWHFGPFVRAFVQLKSSEEGLHGSRLETFNPMFPAGYYYGGPLNEQIGPKNAIILQPELDLHPTATLGIYLKTLFVWREDSADGLYDTPGFLVLPGSVNSQRFVGTSPEVLISQQLGRHLAVSLNYYHFYRGGFLTGVAGTKDVDYFSIWTSFTF